MKLLHNIISIISLSVLLACSNKTNSSVVGPELSSSSIVEDVTVQELLDSNQGKWIYGIANYKNQVSTGEHRYKYYYLSQDDAVYNFGFDKKHEELHSQKEFKTSKGIWITEEDGSVRLKFSQGNILDSIPKGYEAFLWQDSSSDSSFTKISALNDSVLIIKESYEHGATIDTLVFQFIEPVFNVDFINFDWTMHEQYKDSTLCGGLSYSNDYFPMQDGFQYTFSDSSTWALELIGCDDSCSYKGAGHSQLEGEYKTVGGMTLRNGSVFLPSTDTIIRNDTTRYYDYGYTIVSTSVEQVTPYCHYKDLLHLRYVDEVVYIDYYFKGGLGVVYMQSDDETWYLTDFKH